jgi:hypothetical protein
MKLNLIAALLGLALCAPALADTPFSASVTDVTAEHMPGSVIFQLSGSPCPGYFVFSSPDPQANKAVYGMLLEAVLSAGSVWVQYDAVHDDGHCNAREVHGVQVPPPEQDRRDRRRLLRKAATAVVKLLVLGI